MCLTAGQPLPGKVSKEAWNCFGIFHKLPSLFLQAENFLTLCFCLFVCFLSFLILWLRYTFSLRYSYHPVRSLLSPELPFQLQKMPDWSWKGLWVGKPSGDKTLWVLFFQSCSPSGSVFCLCQRTINSSLNPNLFLRNQMCMWGEELFVYDWWCQAWHSWGAESHSFR